MLRRRWILVVALLLLGLAAGLFAVQQVGRFAVELERHSHECIQEGFNTTLSWGHLQRVRTGRIERTLLFLGDGEPLVVIDLCNRSLWGDLAVSLADSGGRVVFSASGRLIEVRDALDLEQGEYTLTIEWRRAGFGGTSLCLKGGTVWVQEPAIPFTEVAARPGAGFSWPYLLHVPDGVPVTALLVEPNNTGTAHDWFRPHLEAAKGRLERAGAWAEDLGVAVLVPVFPRPQSSWQIYTHALDRDCLNTEESGLVRLDLQLAAMIADAQQRLADREIAVHEKVLLYGFSASAMFANRFTLLHPELVAGMACGSPGGWPIAPVAAHDGRDLPYPIGTGDLEQLIGMALDLEAVRQVPMYLFVGGDDNNDSVPYRDGYEVQDQELIDSLFGATPVERWPAAERLYQEACCSATFKLFPGVGHEVSGEMEEGVLGFFHGVLREMESL